MHFSVPMTEEVYEDPVNRKNQHTSYQIHLNGGYLCSIRFKRFFDFHEQLKKEYDASLLAPFPEKKLLALTPEQVDERRHLLEKYLQKISQEPQIVNGELFVNFMKTLQKEQHVDPKEVELPIYLANGNKIFLKCLTSDQTDDIFEAVCRDIELPPDLTYYFGLFIIEMEGSLSGRIVRKLQDFECPHKALQLVKRRSNIQFRKAYWSRDLDKEILKLDRNDVALNVLYIQLANDMKAGHFGATPEEQGKLQALKKAGDRRGFVEFACNMKNYGQLAFKPASCSWPEFKSDGAIGLVSGAIKYLLATGEELFFPVSRIRCWKIQEADETFELSIHFLKAKDDLVWVDFKTPHGIFISMCIQNIIDELVRLRKGERIRLPSDRQSTRVEHIVKVEPSEATIRGMQEAELTPHVPPTPTSPNAVASFDPPVPGVFDGFIDKVAGFFSTPRRASTSQVPDGIPLKRKGDEKEVSDANQGFAHIGDEDL